MIRQDGQGKATSVVSCAVNVAKAETLHKIWYRDGACALFRRHMD